MDRDFKATIRYGRLSPSMPPLLKTKAPSIGRLYGTTPEMAITLLFLRYPVHSWRSISFFHLPGFGMLRHPPRSFPFFFLALLVSSAEAASTSEARVRKVVDGDTLELQSLPRPVRVRLAAIDAPEYNQPYGMAARNALTTFVEVGMAGAGSRLFP